MAMVREFTSFDFDHDEDLRNLLVGQSKNPDSPFEMADWSVKEVMVGNWKEKVRTRIKKTDQVIVICGTHTNTATGVSAEIQIAIDENIPYFLIRDRKDKVCNKPNAAKANDKVYKWS